MTTLGPNLKITAPRSAQTNLRALYAALGAERKEPSATFDVFTLGGANIGYAYVPETEALTPAQLRLAPWYELIVDDEAATIAKLEQLGIERIEYMDKARAYFADPAGAIFRVAPKPR